MESALNMCREGKSIPASTKAYGLSEATLQNRFKMQEEGKTLVGSGRKIVIGEQKEKQLADCIKTMCNVGFNPSLHKIKEIVREYVKSNKLIVFEFYDTLEKVMLEKQFLSSQIWNLDESGFPTDAGRCKVIAPKGEVANKITSGAGHENITVLPACNASGKAIDPLVIFTGKSFQSSWKGKSPLPNTMYGVSDNGWMNTQVLHQWFEKFCSQVTERLLLIIYDEHLSHISISLIEKLGRGYYNFETATSCNG